MVLSVSFYIEHWPDVRLEKECACVMRAEAAAALSGQPPKVIDEEVARFR